MRSLPAKSRATGWLSRWAAGNATKWRGAPWRAGAHRGRQWWSIWLSPPCGVMTADAVIHGAVRLFVGGILPGAMPQPHFHQIRRPAQIFASDTPVGTRIRGRDVPWVGHAPSSITQVARSALDRGPGGRLCDRARRGASWLRMRGGRLLGVSAASTSCPYI